MICFALNSPFMPIRRTESDHVMTMMGVMAGLVRTSGANCQRAERGVTESWSRDIHFRENKQTSSQMNNVCNGNTGLL